ncbi:TetR-like C-terminal domain-containing protein [Kribbella monticola]|uniref:TetR-like C-terminal domain-containing protein n=1 Tax=Kribbella monticola TaxID=2185285 RepID=UPI000DD4192B|nr:TetR-like C-terminal domain-containing protein [Kribbella monticola]
MASSPARRAPGGPVLQDAVTEAIGAAMFEELAAVGYGKLTVEAVAKRAGAGKAAVYRRWPSKQAMVIDLVTRVATTTADAPDTGTLRGDVLEFLSAGAKALTHPLMSRIVPDLLAEGSRNPEVAAILLEQVGGTRRKKAAAILHRAIQRGELPVDTDLELGLDFLAGPLYWRVGILRDPMDPERLNHLADKVVAAIAAPISNVEVPSRP